MKANIGSNEISYDGRKESLLVSIMAQNCDDDSEFRKKIDGELLGFAKLIPLMEPEHLVVVSWLAGYDMGYPMDYYGIGAIACSTIKPWKYHHVDHIIQHRNPFSKLTDAKLLAEISLDHSAKNAGIMEWRDSMYNYFLPQVDLEKVFGKIGFSYNYLQLGGDGDTGLDYFQDD